MIRHIALLTWKEGTSTEAVEMVARALRELPRSVPRIRRYELGSDLGLSPDNASFAVVADFDDIGGYEEYRDHPAHRAVLVEHIAPILADRRSMQVELGGA